VTAILPRFLGVVRLAESVDFTPSLHPRGPDGRFTHSFARLMTDDQKGHARRAAAAFKPRQGINTPEGARAYLSGIGKPSPAVATYFGGGHREVNQALRAGSDNYPGVKAMDQSMQPLPDDIIVTRRVPIRSLGDATPEQLLSFRVADAGYTAGSVATLPGDPNHVLMHIAVPKGTRAAINPDNGSIVLDRGLEMSVLHVAPNEHGGKDMFLIATPHDDRRDSVNSPDLPGDGDGKADAANPPGDGASAGTPNDSAPAPTARDSEHSSTRPADGGQTADGGSRSGTLARATANASEDPTSFADADPALRDAVHQAFDTKIGNLTASLDDRVSQVYVDGDGRTVVRAEGYIRNDQNKIVGSFRRVMYPETGEVHNDTFALAAGEQGSGFAQQFAQHAEPELAKLGLTHATVSASGPVGGYAWRRYGWDPDNPNAKGDVPDRLRTIAAKYDLSPADKATVQQWLTAFGQPDQSKWPTPSEIGDFGKRQARKDDAGRDMWFGKAVLAGSNWQGRRDLNTGVSA
jgi:hypothetical protein